MAGLRAAVAVVGLHYLVNLAHGVAHAGVPVALTAPQTVFVVAVVGLAPLVSLLWLRQGRVRLAWASLAAVLVAGFLFGVAFHYVLATPDHVANVPAGAWKLPFQATAGLVALADGGGAVLAAWFATRSEGRDSTSFADSTP